MKKIHLNRIDYEKKYLIRLILCTFKTNIHFSNFCKFILTLLEIFLTKTHNYIEQQNREEVYLEHS